MRKFSNQTLVPAFAAVLFCLGGERKSAEQLDSAPEKTASQPIALEPVIVREQPRGAHRRPIARRRPIPTLRF